MDFFERQDQARRNTFRLTLYFVLAVALTVVLVYAAVAAMFLRQTEAEGLLRFWDPGIFAAVTGGTLLVILIGSLVKTAGLSKGGGAVARMLGGVPIQSNTTDPDERKLLNVVEEMSIASGTPVPEVYLLPNENGINAFAAGFQTTDAAIGVTRGCVRLLSRDELQGVIAHEFSHILNGDMRLNIRLMGLVFGLLGLTVIGRILLYSGARRHHHHRHYVLGARSSGRGGNPLPLLGLALIIIGGIGVFFGRLIKSAVSRQREYLADAAAVQFTRNPAGLSGALQKIGGLTYGSRIRSARAEEASHMFFGNGLGQSWLQAFATHPPLVDRIRAIDPQFDGKFPRVDSRALETPPPPSPKEGRAGKSRSTRPPALPDLLGMAAAGAAGQASRPPPLPASGLMQQVGHPQSSHLDFAVQLMAAMPPILAEAARDPLGATALVYGMLLSSRKPVQTQQLEQLRQQVDPRCQEELKRLQPSLQELPDTFRLPAIELAFPALRQLSASQYEQFRNNTRMLIECDEELDLFEFALRKMLQRHLDGHFRPGKRKKITQYHSLRPLLPDLTVLLSALAHVGHSKDENKARAFAAGLEVLRPESSPSLLPLNQCHLGRIDEALDKLAQASPPLKKRCLTAAVATVSADQEVKSREAELLRAIADTLDCPMPPLLAQ